MAYIIHYDIGAVVILTVTLLIYTLKKKVRDKSSRLFSALLWCTLISTIFDIGATVCQNNPSAESGIMLYNTGYFLTHNAVPVLFLAYIEAVTNSFSGKSKIVKFLIFSPYILNALLVCINPFYTLYFYIDDAGVYHRSGFLYVAYIISAYFLFFAVFLVIKNIKNMSRSLSFPICAFIVVSVVSVALQAIFPTFLVECFGISVCLIIIMFTLQSQSDVIEQETSMLNKTMFARDFSAAFKEKERLSLLLIRIPDYKMVLDTFGSTVSGKLLSTFSQYIYKLVRFGEAYYLDDECFALVSKDDMEAPKRLYENLSARMEESWQIVGAQIYISTYMMEIHAPEDVSDYDSLDECVTQFKSHDFTTKRLLNGKDIHASNSQRRKEVERAIENSLGTDGFWVCYQPIFNVKEGKINSCEALVRLRDEKLGNVFPDEFIPIAERNGSIIDIGKFVFENACAFIKDKRAVELGIEFVHINLSVVQCMHPGLADELAKIMSDYGVKPEQICLEITETASAFTPHIMEKNIQEISEKGIIIALDDFGTGYSNMNNLLRFPFKFIKFDKNIVWNSFETTKGQIAFESAVAMINKLGLGAVAEGVENHEQEQKLIGYNCEYLQGYLFSKPVKKDEFFERVREINFNGVTP